VCAQPTVERRRLAAAPEASTRASAVRGVEPWPSLLTTLSHELRSSLNAIRGWVALAEGGSLPADRIPRALTIIGRNAESLSAVVENLFDLSRRAAGSLALKLEMLDLNHIVEFVAESMYPAAHQHGLTLTVNCSRAASFVNGDRIRLEQVVRNLVDNAMKFTAGGGKVNLRTVRKDSFVEVIVNDNGTGISPDLLPAIFDPFRRGGSVVRQSDVGVGLGLALVRELVQLHQGEVQAVSGGEGHGSTFTVRLPLASAPGRAAGRKASVLTAGRQ
jgi:signal transduction histidine kinase